MDRSPSRRRFLHLSGLVAVSSAGCLGVFSNADMADLRLNNGTSGEITVTTTITRSSDGEELLSDTVTLQADGVHQYRDPIQEEGTYQIHVSVEGGDENLYEWDAPADEAAGLHISITDDGIGFSEVIA